MTAEDIRREIETLSGPAEEIRKTRHDEHYSTGSVSDLSIDQQAF